MSTGKQKNYAFIVLIFFFNFEFHYAFIVLKTTLYISTLNDTTSFIHVPGDNLHTFLSFSNNTDLILSTKIALLPLDLQIKLRSLLSYASKVYLHMGNAACSVNFIG